MAQAKRNALWRNDFSRFAVRSANASRKNQASRALRKQRIHPTSSKQAGAAVRSLGLSKQYELNDGPAQF